MRIMRDLSILPLHFFNLFFSLLLFCSPVFSHTNNRALAEDGPAAPTQCSTDLNNWHASINLLWINKETSPYILPTTIGPRRKFSNRQPIDTIQRLKDWSYSGYPVVLWFDSTSVDSIDNAKKELQNHLQQAGVTFAEALNPDGSIDFAHLVQGKTTQPSTIFLQDIRALPGVKQYPELFSPEDDIGLFNRIDLIKEALTLDTLKALNDNQASGTGSSVEGQPAQAVVFSDFSIPPLAAEQLFDAQTCANLREFGLVMAKSKKANFENGFQITALAPEALNFGKMCIEQFFLLHAFAKANHKVFTGDAFYGVLSYLVDYLAYLKGDMRLDNQQNESCTAEEHLTNHLQKREQFFRDHDLMDVDIMLQSQPFRRLQASTRSIPPTKEMGAPESQGRH